MHKSEYIRIKHYTLKSCVCVMRMNHQPQDVHALSDDELQPAPIVPGAGPAPQGQTLVPGRRPAKKRRLQVVRPTGVSPP